MSLTVTESQAVFDLLHWLADDERADGVRAADALVVLGEHAGNRLQMSPRALLERVQARLVELRAAEESDGAAQAVCRAIDDHRRHYPSVPWSSVLRLFEEWRAIQLRTMTTEEVPTLMRQP